MLTRWGAEVSADNAWTEYPRPQLQRDDWKNLNGVWDHAITAVDQKQSPDKWDGEILVPFCLESKLGRRQGTVGGGRGIVVSTNLHGDTP
ncbi:MAG: hypothetical protein R3C05_29010 [Pirellulaceae bacterium]